IGQQFVTAVIDLDRIGHADRSGVAPGRFKGAGAHVGRTNIGVSRKVHRSLPCSCSVRILPSYTRRASDPSKRGQISGLVPDIHRTDPLTLPIWCSAAIPQPLASPPLLRHYL